MEYWKMDLFLVSKTLKNKKGHVFILISYSKSTMQDKYFFIPFEIKTNLQILNY